jgi:hypothetical protein
MVRSNRDSLMPTSATGSASRIHVRKTLQDAEQVGLVGLSGRGGRFVELMPSVRRAFAPFVADSMSGHDLLFQIALKQIKG